MFPLNTVLFPGVSVPLHVFEDRYRAMVHHLLRESDPAQRVFGSVAIREGYEVGEHGRQELHRVGCRLQLTEVQAHPNGSFDIVAVGRDRIRLERMDTSGPFPAGQVTELPDNPWAVPQKTVTRAREAFARYAAAIRELRGDPDPGELPREPAYLAWVLAAAAPLTLPDRQSLLEARDPAVRLRMVTALFREELRSMRAIPSLPATEVARTGWSPN